MVSEHLDLPCSGYTYYLLLLVRPSRSGARLGFGPQPPCDIGFERSHTIVLACFLDMGP
jgi:hypothetical protein